MPPEFDPADQRRLQLVHQLRAISVQLDLARAAFGQANGLHDTDVRALICLLDADRAGIPVTPGYPRLARRPARAHLPATTALLDRLEQAGHVYRQRSLADRRKVQIGVSAAAIDLGWTFFGPLLTSMIGAMRALSSAELDTVSRFLAEVAAVVRWSAPPL